jgi:serine/threonine protein kinase
VAIELKEGSVLAGRFRLERLLGQGGMGVVWAATNTATGRRVAIKMLRDANAEDPHVRRRFLREGRAASAVQHPNVVEILDVFELEDQTPAMVMELLDGESLGQRLRRVQTLSVEEMARLLVPAVAAVGAAHSLGVVHRDLKPDNIFLAIGHEGATTVKVLDFGIAKITSESDQGQSAALTGTGAMLGTPYYMAPEQLFSDETLDYRCDIWALGIICYECLAGKRPTRGDTFADIVKVIATHSILRLETAAPDVPPEVCDLVGRMLSFDKDKRPQSLREVLVVLQHYTDVNATSFREPMLKPIKQAPGLNRSDVEFMVGEPHANADNVTVEAPSGGAPAPDASNRTLDLGFETRRLSTLDTGATARPETLLEAGAGEAAVGIGKARRAWRYVVPAGLVATAIAVVSSGAVRPSRSVASGSAAREALSIPTVALPASSASVAPESSAVPAVSLALPSTTPAVGSAAPRARPAPPAHSAATAARGTTATAQAAPTTRPDAPGDSTGRNPSTSPGGLVEKPPF